MKLNTKGYGLVNRIRLEKLNHCNWYQYIHNIHSKKTKSLKFENYCVMLYEKAVLNGVE